MSTVNTLFILLFLSSTLLGQTPVFVDDTDALGIEHSFVLGTSGGGISFADFNGDGLDDISLGTAQGEQPHFYINQGDHFEKIDLQLDNQFENKSILWVDIDNDGDKDLFIAAMNGVNRLYEQVDSLQFAEITISCGLPLELVRTFGAVSADFDRDGWLDIYYTSRTIPGMGGTMRNRLFRNLGDKTFTEVTDSLGAEDEGRLPFCSAFFDYNRDKWLDIYIANDREKRNTLLHHNGSNYDDLSDTLGAGIYMDGMNVAIADIDNDGWDDIYITNIAEGNVMLHLDQPMDSTYRYKDEAIERNTGFFAASWGANFLDVDQDGWQDLYVSGAEVGSDTSSSALYLNLGDGYYQDYINHIPGDTVKSYTNAIGDWNNDGRPDIAVNNADEWPSKIYTNQTETRNYIKIKLEGVASNRQGIGSRVEIYSGDLYQNLFTFCGIAFMGQNSDVMTTGLADYPMVDSCVVTWPSGHIDRLLDLEANMLHLITEGMSTDGIIYIDEELMVDTTTNQQDTTIMTSVIEESISTGTIHTESIVELYTLDGRKVAVSNHIHTLNIAGLPKGNYIILIREGYQQKPRIIKTFIK